LLQQTLSGKGCAVFHATDLSGTAFVEKVIAAMGRSYGSVSIRRGGRIG